MANYVILKWNVGCLKCLIVNILSLELLIFFICEATPSRLRGSMTLGLCGTEASSSVVIKAASLARRTSNSASAISPSLFLYLSSLSSVGWGLGRTALRIGKTITQLVMKQWPHSPVLKGAVPLVAQGPRPCKHSDFQTAIHSIVYGVPNKEVQTIIAVISYPAISGITLKMNKHCHSNSS